MSGNDHGSELELLELRVRALESLLVEKQFVDPQALNRAVEMYKHEVGPRNGTQVVAKAWADPVCKDRLLGDATAAIASLGFLGRQGEDMMALENTPTVYSLVVCKLCSCLSVAGARFSAGLVSSCAVSRACGECSA